MTRSVSTMLAVLATGLAAPSLNAATGATSTDTIRVASPTGFRDADRANILTALEQVEPGGIIQFGPGTYLVGEVIRIETPRITLLGHPEGTTLRGCNPDEYEQSDRDLARARASAEGAAVRDAASRCGMLELTGGDVTVRGLTFEHSRMGLILGCCQLELRFRSSEGGYLIERNTFRSSLNGIRPFTTERSVIRGNRFVNTFHAISGAGSHLHVLDNEISAPAPDQVPVIGHPSFALALGPLPRRAAESMGVDANGEGNVIAGNRIEGHPDGIYLSAPPGTRFRNNVIRDNTILVDRVTIPSSGARPYIVDVADERDSTIVGIPLALYAREGPPGPASQETEEGSFDDNLIEGNRLIGAEGVGIAIRRGSRNRIVGNTITRIRRREPFPGNTVLSSSERWREANGSGIWLSPESRGNEVVGNTFEDIAAHAVVLEGDSNRVELESAGDSVLDLGSGNDITVRANATERATGGAAAAALTPSHRDGVADSILVLTPVTVVDVREGVARPGMTVVVTGDRITAVGPAGSVEVPAGARVVDGTAAYLIPGLWDMHVHSSSDRITRETILPLFVAHGVTGVRDMKADCLDPCEELESSIAQVQQWRRDIAAGSLVGPRIVAGSWLINGPPPDGPSSVEAPSTEAQGRALARLLKERGVDFAKTYNMLPRDAFFGLLDEARRLGLPVAGHVPLGVRASEAADAGMRSMAHAQNLIEECSTEEEEIRDQLVSDVRTNARTPGVALFRALASFSQEKCATLYTRFAEHGMWQVPTLTADKAMERSASGIWWLDDPRIIYLPPEECDYWLQMMAGSALDFPGGFSAFSLVMQRKLEIVGAMARAGVPILAGSDSQAWGVFAGSSLHDELELLVKAGLTPADALRAATLGPAEYLEATDSLGTVAPDKLADLVLLEANPLEDIRNTRRIRAVVAGGRFLDRAALDALLADIARAARPR